MKKLKDRLETAFAVWLFTPKLKKQVESQVEDETKPLTLASALALLKVIFSAAAFLAVAWGYIMIMWAAFVAFGGE